MSSRIAIALVGPILGSTMLVSAEADAAKAGMKPVDTRASAPTFETLDADKNARISRDEAAQYPTLADAFEQADADRDGRISIEEYLQILDRKFPG